MKRLFALALPITLLAFSTQQISYASPSIATAQYSESFRAFEQQFNQLPRDEQVDLTVKAHGMLVKEIAIARQMSDDQWNNQLTRAAHRHPIMMKKLIKKFHLEGIVKGPMPKKDEMITAVESTFKALSLPLDHPITSDLLKNMDSSAKAPSSSFLVDSGPSWALIVFFLIFFFPLGFIFLMIRVAGHGGHHHHHLELGTI